jgi:hypothetical protein
VRSSRSLSLSQTEKSEGPAARVRSSLFSLSRLFSERNDFELNLFPLSSRVCLEINSGSNQRSGSIGWVLE